MKRRDLIRATPAVLAAPTIFAAGKVNAWPDTSPNPIDPSLPTTGDIEAEIARVPQGGVVDLKGGTYQLDRTLRLVTGRTIANATLLAANGDADAIEIKDTFSGPRGGNVRNVLENVRLDGRGEGRGIVISARSVGLESVNISDFGRGIEAGPGSYIWAFNKLWVHECGTALWFLGHTLRNSGENIAFHSCTFDGSHSSGVSLTGCNVSMFACSVDYNEGYGLNIGWDAHVVAFGCHFETWTGKKHVHTYANGKFNSHNSRYIWTPK